MNSQIGCKKLGCLIFIGLAILGGVVGALRGSTSTNQPTSTQNSQIEKEVSPTYKQVTVTAKGLTGTGAEVRFWSTPETDRKLVGVLTDKEVVSFIKADKDNYYCQIESKDGNQGWLMCDFLVGI
jgi:hypothetical protein